MVADVWPTLFIPHGGGPCFFMDPRPSWPRDTWDRMAAFLRGLDASFGRRPAAVLVVSGHRAAPRPTLDIAPRPQLLFDYHGFPAHTCQLPYPVAGAPALAAEAGALLRDAGFVTTRRYLSRLLPHSDSPVEGMRENGQVPASILNVTHVRSD